MSAVYLGQMRLTGQYQICPNRGLASQRWQTQMILTSQYQMSQVYWGQMISTGQYQMLPLSSLVSPWIVIIYDKKQICTQKILYHYLFTLYLTKCLKSGRGGGDPPTLRSRWPLNTCFFRPSPRKGVKKWVFKGQSDFLETIQVHSRTPKSCFSLGLEYRWHIYSY